MNISSLHIGSMLMCLLFAGCDRDAVKCCSCLDADGKSDVYHYPITPGSPEWANLKTGEEMYAACQIPEEELLNMCPVGLVDSWLTYPMRSAVFAWDFPQIGLENMTGNFNGLSELLKRPGSTDVLIKRYGDFNPSGYMPGASTVERGRYSVDLFILELTLAQYEILGQLTQVQKKELVKEALDKRRLKLEDELYAYPGDIHVLHHSSDAYIMARIMIQEKYQPFLSELDNNSLLDHFIRTCQYVYPVDSNTPEKDLLAIIHYSESYANN